MTGSRTLTFVVPDGVDDERRVSGGNVYDLRVADALAELGWRVRTVAVSADAAASVLSGLDAGALVLIDGLVAGGCADAVEAEASRVTIVVVAHMASAAFDGADPGVVDRERRALRAASRVVTTSAWTASELIRSGTVDGARIRVAQPGVDDAPVAAGTRGDCSLLCIGVVAPHKGQDVLVDALARIASAPGWTCTMAGSREAHPGYAERVEARAREAGIADRVRFAGVLSRPALEGAYAAADLVVAPSRVESYGMAVAEALRRGIPVVASAAGGLREAVAGSRSVVLVPPGDVGALADALARWMSDPALRERLTAAARADRGRGRTWRDTAVRVSAALEEAAA